MHIRELHPKNTKNNKLYEYLTEYFNVRYKFKRFGTLVSMENLKQKIIYDNFPDVFELMYSCKMCRPHVHFTRNDNTKLMEISTQTNDFCRSLNSRNQM